MASFVPAAPGTCDVASSLQASRVTHDGALLSWTPAGSATSYNIRYAPRGTSDWVTVSSASRVAKIDGLSPSTPYKYQVQSVCNGGLVSPFSSKGTFATLGVPPPLYCGASGSRATFEWIGSVSLGAISHLSGSNGGYEDNSAITADLTVGLPYTLTVSPGSATADLPKYWRVWIDWNRDLVFDDGTELVFAADDVTGSTGGAIAVPSFAASGFTIMRVAMRHGEPPTACGDQGDGEVEDYGINVVASDCASISPTINDKVPASGGMFAIQVSAEAGCGWTVSTTVPWITLGTTGGTGNATIFYTAPANELGTARSGIINVGDNVFAVTQAGTPPPSCTLSLTPGGDPNAPASQGARPAISVSASASTCTWSATANVPWITIASPTGVVTGSGSISYSLAANNSTSPRSGTITAGGVAFAVTQAGVSCCAWTATSNASWIVVNSGASGTGNGTVVYSVAPNFGTGATFRMGAIKVGDQTFTISQEACSFYATPTVFTYSSNLANSDRVQVSAPGGCSWTAASNSPWITITSGASGSGSAFVQFSVSTNTQTTYPTARTGTMTVAGQTITVTQAGQPACGAGSTGLSSDSSGVTGTSGKCFTSSGSTLARDDHLRLAQAHRLPVAADCERPVGARD